MTTRLLTWLLASTLIGFCAVRSPELPAAGASPRLVSDQRRAQALPRAPRPCLVPPVPLKKSLPPRVGGAANPVSPFRGGGRQSLRIEAANGIEPRTIRLLAIRADFSDKSIDSTDVYYNRLLLFLHQFYRDTSDGRVLWQPTLTPVYRMPKTLAYYGEDDSLGSRESLFCYDAVQAADSAYNFNDFDQVVVFHAGGGQESDVKNDSPEQLWSVFFRKIDFSYYLDRPGHETGIRTSDRTAKGDTIYVPSVGIYPETQAQDGYVFSCVGVVCHEMGHALGLPDLYDTTAPPGKFFAESQGIGSWDLMAAGTWNANGFVPAEFSAWSKVFLGWIDPVVVEQDGTVRLSAVERNRRTGVVKVPMNGDEYFLLENRSQDPNGDGAFNFEETDSTTCSWEHAGADSTRICLFDFYRDTYSHAEWDHWLPGEGKGSGLLIWHVDDSVIRDNLIYNTVNADASHKGIDLEEADGIQDMDFVAVDAQSFGSPKDVYRAGGVDRFAPDTRPNSHGYYGIDSGITIDQISPADTAMSFRVVFGGVHDQWPLTTPAPFGHNDAVVANLDSELSTQEIAVADRAGNLYVLRANGAPAWPAIGAGGAFAQLHTPVGTPVLADVTGDGVADYLVMADDGRVFGFEGGSPGGAPLGPDGSGLLLTSSNPMPGVTLWAQDVDGDGKSEFSFGGALDSSGQLSRLEIYGYSGAGAAIRHTSMSLRGGSGELPATVVHLPWPSGSSASLLLAAVRSDSADTLRGGLQLHRLVGPSADLYVLAPLPDTVYCSAPVVGDLNRDGQPEAVVTASNGLIYVFTLSITPGGQPQFTLLAGWPRPALASGDDAISLADVDGNGYPEVLTLETGGVLHVFNYSGESLVNLPRQLPSEVRYFYEPQLAPLVADLDGEGPPEIVLPLGDGQVRAMKPNGAAYGGWNFFGGGDSGASPALARLTTGGSLSLVLVSNYQTGGRVDVRNVGTPAGKTPIWGMVRRDAGASGQLKLAQDPPIENGPALTDVFAMPNPARESVRFHYRVGAGVTAVRLDLIDMSGRAVRRLDGTGSAGVDNNIGWDLKSDSGASVAPGIYLGRLEVQGAQGKFSQFVKLAVVR